MDELSDAAIDSVLKQVGFGFLGLARDDRPYVIPMSFGYDGEDLYFQMNSSGRKFDYIEPGALASFTTVHVDQETGTSTSVVVEGTMDEVPEPEATHAMEALAANANFGTDLAVWGVPLQEADLAEYVLRPDSISGRSYG